MCAWSLRARSFAMSHMAYACQRPAIREVSIQRLTWIVSSTSFSWLPRSMRWRISVIITSLLRPLTKELIMKGISSSFSKQYRPGAMRLHKSQSGESLFIFRVQGPKFLALFLSAGVQLFLFLLA